MKKIVGPFSGGEINTSFENMLTKLNGEPLHVVYRRYLPDHKTMSDYIVAMFQDGKIINERPGKGGRLLLDDEWGQSSCFLYGFPFPINEDEAEYLVHFEIFGTQMKAECVNTKSHIRGKVQFIRNAKQLPPGLDEIFQKFKGQ